MRATGMLHQACKLDSLLAMSKGCNNQMAGMFEAAAPDAAYRAATVRKRTARRLHKL